MLKGNKPIIIQGAMSIEVEELLKLVEIEKEENINGFKFYFGKINNYPVIISETEIGTINASMATCTAIQRFDPLVIINQGISGSHMSNIHRNDIVIGEKSVNVNSFITAIKSAGEGTNPFEWSFDKRSFEVKCDEGLLKLVHDMNGENYNLFYGVLGSGDIFNREIDRIRWIHEKKNTLSEDNESIAVYTICKRFNVPCIGFRTITNNEVTQKESDGSTSTRKNLAKDKIISKEHDSSPAKISQEFTFKYVKELINKM